MAVAALDDWNLLTLGLFESGGNVYVTLGNVGHTGGVIVLNATLAQVQNQIGII